MDQLDAFLAWHARLNHSPLTIAAYRQTLTALARQLPTFTTAKRPAVRAAVDEVLHGAPATYNRGLAAIKSFYTWAVEHELRPDNPVLGLRAAKLRERLPKALDATTVDRLLTAPDTTPRSVRDTAIVATLLATGLRLAELCALNVTDLYQDELRVVGKGDKERLVFLDRRAQAALNTWLRVRVHLHPHDEALFINVRGQRLERTTVRRLLTKRAAGQHVSPHMLRHTFATTLVGKDVPIEKVRRLMGHATSATTQKYVKIADRDLKRSYQEVMH